MLRINKEVAEFLAFEAAIDDPNIGQFKFRDIYDVKQQPDRSLSIVIFQDSDGKLFGFDVIFYHDQDKNPVFLDEKEGFVDCRSVVYDNEIPRYED